MPLFDNTAADAIYSGTQTLLTERDNAVLQIKVLKRKLACRDEQLAEATEREEHLSKRLHGANSFRARYDVMKPMAEELLGEGKYKKLYDHTQEQALVVHKKYTVKHQAERDTHKAAMEELEAACAKDVAKLKKEVAGGRADAKPLPCDPNHPWQAEAMKKANGAPPPNGKKGKGKPAAADDDEAPPPKKKKSPSPTAYNRFLADKEKKAEFNALVAQGKFTSKDWFGWAGAAWKEMDAEARQPYVDQLNALLAAKAQEAADDSDAPHPGTLGIKASKNPKPAAAASSGGKGGVGKPRPVLAATAAAAPAEAAAKKAKKPIVNAFEAMAEGANGAPNGAAKGKGKKVAIDSDDEEEAPPPKKKKPAAKPRGSKFVLDEADEGDEDEDEDEDDEEGEEGEGEDEEGEGEGEDDDDEEVAEAEGSDGEEE